MKKSIIAILMTTVFILAMIAPVFTVKATTDPSDWYMTTKGVLASDYYSLYPYETTTNLNVGFSKFGELINSQTNTGLEFGAVDSFAPPGGSGLTTQVPKHMWVQGWFLNITYNHRTLGPRNVWAMALFSDSINYGGDWIRVDFPADKSSTWGLEDPRDPGSNIYGAAPYNSNPSVYGGRKTNGTAVTEPINVLYDGPREFIAECRTTIWDHPLFGDNNTESDIGLVQIVITIVFDKVKKEVNLLKDVKSIMVLKEGEKMKIQFSNRGEVDLGTDAGTYASYAHFYTQGTVPINSVANDTSIEGYPTKYNSDWTLVRTQPNQTTGPYAYFTAAGPYPQLPGTQATIDVAQAINSNIGVVWYAAFWPSLSDWTIDGWENWYHSLMAYDPHYIDIRGTIDEPNVPFYIGEWDFELYFALDVEMRTQFRGVTEYGTVYQHDAADNQMAGAPTNKLDSEVKYYLDQTFNPWDLQQAADKYTKRWVEFPTPHASSYTTVRFPVKNTGENNADWKRYGVFSERIEDLNTGALLRRGYDYGVTYLSNGKATFNFATNTYHLKVLYSTDASSYSKPGDLSFDTFFHSYADVNNGTTKYQYDDDSLTWTDPVGAVWTAEIDDFDIATTLTYANESFSQDFSRELNGWAQNFEVFKNTLFTGSWDYQNLAPLVYTSQNYSVSIAIPLIDIHWSVLAPEFQDLRISELGFTASIDFTVDFNATTQQMNVTAEIDLDPANPYAGFTYLYTEGQWGRYEWVVVGRDAATVDSAGAALVAEAYDSYKEVQIGIAGEDMFGATYDVQIPSVMWKFGAGTAVAAYKDAPGVGNEVGYRAALIDDWCTYWPVTTSNMIAVGGPLANVLSYYSNDFTSAFYGIPLFSGSEYSGKITGIPCWNRAWPINGGMYNVYSSADSTRYGYAVVSTYIDINGTEVLEVYGHFARDTYYAAQWLHGDLNRGITPGLLELQRAPAGVTSIILKIDYYDAKHPTFSIPEVLGTISERLWHDHGATDVTSDLKGGIHDNA